MAGAGFRTFVDGDILTAAQVNTYLMQQSVMVFATAAARTSAIAAPSEGMVTYLADNDLIEYYDGAAWQPLLDQDVIAAKGDLIVGTGDDTVAALSVGTNGHVLTADSSTATGLKWAAAAGGGKVLQVVSATTTTAATIGSQTFTDTNLSASITPSAASSKVLVLVSQQAAVGDNNLGASGAYRLLRGATEIFAPYGTNFNESIGGFIGGPTITSLGYQTILSIAYLDSPNTTSSTTYKTQGRRETNSAGEAVYFQLTGSASSIVLLEIGA